MIGATGKDDHAGMLLDNLKKVGVDISGIKKTDTNTGLAVIYVNREGENCIVVLAGANNIVNMEQIDEMQSYIENSDWVDGNTQRHDGVCYQKSGGNEEKNIFNPAPASESFSKELYNMIDIITPNKTELQKCR